MNYGEIKDCDIANGEGVRISLFVSGCTHHCKNCFNAKTWDFNFGEKFTQETENKIIDMLAPNHINGLSLLGGEPFEPENQKVLLPFLKKVKKTYPNKTIWCYSGYTVEQILGDSRANCDTAKEMLSMINILVDGEFVQDLYDISLKFRGSSNQRIVDIQKSLSQNKIVLYMD